MKSATVYRRADGFYLHADSQTTQGVWITAAARCKLAVDASPETLGRAGTNMLQASERGVPHPAQDDWGKAFTPMFELAGVKTWAAFARHALNVGVRTNFDSESLIIEPWENAGTKNGFVPMPGMEVRVPIDAPPAEIGEAIIKAMQLCVPQYR
jgi:hypothetical protein